MLNRKKFRLGWQRSHNLPTLQDPKWLRISPAEQFFRDMFFSLGSWSEKDLTDFVDYLGYEPDPIGYDNMVWLRDQLIEMFDAIDLGNNHWLITEEKVWEFLKA